jgi:hypothetical protein
LADGISSEGFFRQYVEGRGEGRSFEQVLGFASSAALHALALILVLFPLSPGVQGSHGTLDLVPVEVEVAGEHSHAQTGEATEPLPSASVANGTESTDTLETKLQALAKLRQPDSNQPSSQQRRAKSMRLMSDDAAPGHLSAVRDFIRDQVERHWSLDLASVGQEEFSIPIRIEITGSGTVLKAELIDTPRSADPVYHDVASSARNAVLSASPLMLPAGHYQDVMELILHLDPRETLR